VKEAAVAHKRHQLLSPSYSFFFTSLLPNFPTTVFHLFLPYTHRYIVFLTLFLSSPFSNSTFLLNIHFIVRFEAFTAVTMKNVVFWDVGLCRSCVNRRFGGKHRLHFLPQKWRRYFPSKRRLTQDVHSSTSQKTTFFIHFILLNRYFQPSV
jgi:hypothetical protein